MNNYKINNKKYKTIGELLQAPTRSISAVCCRLEDKVAKEYIVKILLQKIVMNGNLTKRIKKITSTVIAEYILINIYIDLTK